MSLMPPYDPETFPIDGSFHVTKHVSYSVYCAVCEQQVEPHFQKVDISTLLAATEPLHVITQRHHRESCKVPE